MDSNLLSEHIMKPCYFLSTYIASFLTESKNQISKINMENYSILKQI